MYNTADTIIDKMDGEIFAASAEYEAVSPDASAICSAIGSAAAAIVRTLFATGER